VTALAAVEQSRRRQRGIAEPFGVADAVERLVKFRDPVQPNPAWRRHYEAGLEQFVARVRAAAG
jgi:hypothetical protein